MTRPKAGYTAEHLFDSRRANTGGGRKAKWSATGSGECSLSSLSCETPSVSAAVPKSHDSGDGDQCRFLAECERLSSCDAMVCTTKLSHCMRPHLVCSHTFNRSTSSLPLSYWGLVNALRTPSRDLVGGHPVSTLFDNCIIVDSVPAMDSVHGHE